MNSKHKLAADGDVRARLETTNASSIVIGFHPVAPRRSFYGLHRHVSILVYEVAAELERRCLAAAVDWVVSPGASKARIVVELVDEDELTAALDLAAGTLADFSIPVVS